LILVKVGSNYQVRKRSLRFNKTAFAALNNSRISEGIPAFFNLFSAFASAYPTRASAFLAFDSANKCYFSDL